MSKKVESGYVKADSGNLPKVNIFMVLDYVKMMRGSMILKFEI